MMISKRTSTLLSSIAILMLTACQSSEDSANDRALKDIIRSKGLTGNALKGRTIPSINDVQPQLGMRLFFSKSLGGDRDSACVTCHHPVLGGGDNLSLSIGVGAESPDLLGEGRFHDSSAADYDAGPPVPRNAPTTFNIAAWDQVLFHDGKVESIGKTPLAHGDDTQGIRTPASAFGTADPLASINLSATQSRFPITSRAEMKGFNHEDKDGQEIREYVASRIGGYGEGAGELSNTDYWLSQFRTAFNNPTATAETLITEQNIALLIGEYERSQAFSNTPWRKYIEGDNSAISASAKEGALLFFQSIPEGGANCASCHSGDLFSDESFHNIAMPQIGRGKGDGIDATADFGRFRETGIETDKYKFKTPSLLNVEVTKPWGHAGAYTSLKTVVRHYINPEVAVLNYDVSQLTQPGIQNLDKMETNTQDAITKLNILRATTTENVVQNVELTDSQINNIVDFLHTLTDPCVKDRGCIDKWIPPENEDPNNDQLDAISNNGVSL